MSIPGPQGITGFSQEKCTQRNRIASLRHLQEAAPVRLGGAGGLKLFASETPSGSVIDEWGDLPKDDDGALERIHKLQPSGARLLEADQVYIRFIESANSNYISDRFMFLGSTTLLNIAKAGVRGVAFMNSHRTGGFSTESELPFGRTFAGRYEQYLLDNGRIFERSIQGFYMLRGSKPVGMNGPDTDEIDNMINAGVLKDVSVGITPGEEGIRLCDVCGNNYYSRDCPHYSGSTYEMSEEQKEAQRRRGVLRGVATYTLENWEQSEVSGVYDGAVPGAGFAKAHEALFQGSLPPQFAEELAAAYAAYL